MVNIYGSRGAPWKFEVKLMKISTGDTLDHLVLENLPNIDGKETGISLAKKILAHTKVFKTNSVYTLHYLSYDDEHIKKAFLIQRTITNKRLIGTLKYIDHKQSLYMVRFYFF